MVRDTRENFISGVFGDVPFARRVASTRPRGW